MTTLQIQIGGKTLKQYQKELKDGGFIVSKWAEDLLGKIPLAKKKKTLNIVRLTVEELGFSGSATYAEICTRAKEKGYELCPAEAALALLLAMPDQTEFKWFTVAHEPVIDSDGDPNLLFVNRSDDGRWLDANYDRPDDRWRREYGFAFVVSQASSTPCSSPSSSDLSSLEQRISALEERLDKYNLV